LSPLWSFFVAAQLQSLELWRHALVASVRGDAPDLSARQMALILSVYLGNGPHTVRGLALALKISKPAVSRALDRLGELGYIRRQRDELDHRNVLVQKTAGGASFLTEFSRLIDAAKEHIAAIPAQVLEFAVEAEPVAASNAIAPAAEMWARTAAE
jgi:DNA-binding MarR family transcriptional regulator